MVVRGTTDKHNVSVSDTNTTIAASERYQRKRSWLHYWLLLVLMNGVSDMVEVIGDMIEG